MENKFQKGEFASCSGCTSRINYFSLCKRIDSKWNGGENQRCPKLICHGCEYCEECRRNVKQIVDQIKKNNQKCLALEAELQVEYGCSDSDVENLKY